MLSGRIWVALLVVLASACGSSAESATADSLTTDSPAVGSPSSERIVSLSGDLTEFVYELGFGGSMVGVDVTTVAPPEALELAGVGIARFLAPEGVLAVEPSLVLADDQTQPQTALDQIEGTGARVVVFDTASSFDGMYAKINDLAELLDAQDRGTELVEQISSEVSAITPVDSQPRIAYIYIRGPGTVLLFGDGMTTQALIEGAGGIDVGAETGATGAVALTPEALVAANPDVIIVPSEGLDELGGVDAFLEIPGVSETAAGANRAVLSYPQGDFLTLGPRAASSLERLVNDLVALEG